MIRQIHFMENDDPLRANLLGRVANCGNRVRLIHQDIASDNRVEAVVCLKVKQVCVNELDLLIAPFIAGSLTSFCDDDWVSVNSSYMA